jgi:alkylmercury lyase-like protein
VNLEDLRLAVYEGLARTGQAPSIEDLRARFATTESDVRAGFQSLAAARHVVLDGEDRILMAHPFATIPLGFAVMGRNALWWGGCAWDSFAIPNVVADEPEVLVSTRCPGCGTPHAWVVGCDAPPDGDQVAHFLVPLQRMWDDVVTTCSNQRIFCSTVCVDQWLAAENLERGYVMDLAMLWRLARHWYDGRLDRGYERPRPEVAGAYFRDVGLRGPFWGLAE